MALLGTENSLQGTWNILKNIQMFCITFGKSSLYSWLRNAFKLGMSSCFVNYHRGGNLFLCNCIPWLSCFLRLLLTIWRRQQQIELVSSLSRVSSDQCNKFSWVLLVKSLNKGLWLVRALFIFTADLGCIVKWTFISGGWETNLVSWSLSSICNIFCYNRPWMVLYYPEPGHWPHPRGL